MLGPMILDGRLTNISAAAYGDHGAGGTTTHCSLIHSTKNWCNPINIDLIINILCKELTFWYAMLLIAEWNWKHGELTRQAGWTGDICGTWAVSAVFTIHMTLTCLRAPAPTCHRHLTVISKIVLPMKAIKKSVNDSHKRKNPLGSFLGF